MKARTSVPALCGALFVVVAACSDYEPKGWLLDRTRILGARTEAVAERSRASLLPGERATVTWLVVNPDAPARLSWSFAVCLVPPGNFAGPRCEGPVLAAGAGSSDGELVAMELETPPLAATGDAHALLVLGAFCASGAAALDPRTFTATCAGGAAALLGSTRVRLAKGGINRNPEIAGDAIRLGDVALPPATLSVPAGPCNGAPEAPVVQAGASAGKVTFRFDDGEREVVPEGHEGLLLSHFVTSGEIDRQYSSLEPDEATPANAAFELTAPSHDAVGPSGRLLRLFFVLRDDRGGMSFAVRSVCVRP